MHLSYNEYHEALNKKNLKILNKLNRSEYGLSCEICGPIIPEDPWYCKLYYGYNPNAFGCGCGYGIPTYGTCRFCGTHVKVRDCTCDNCISHDYNTYSHYHYGCSDCIPNKCINCNLILDNQNIDKVIALNTQQIFYTCKGCCYVYPSNPNEGLDVKDPGYD